MISEIENMLVISNWSKLNE